MPSLRFCSRIGSWSKYLFFFFNDTATTEIYTLSLHDALPIYLRRRPGKGRLAGEHLIEHATEAVDVAPAVELLPGRLFWAHIGRSEEHTSELQSQSNLVCRLLLEKKNHIWRAHYADYIVLPLSGPPPSTRIS